MNATATAHSLKNLFVAMVDDLRRRRLLPIVALLVAVLVAVPIVLARGSSPAPVALHPAAGGAPIDTATGVGVARPTTSHAPRLLGHARNPFVGGAGAAPIGSSGTAAATPPARSAVPVAAAPSASGANLSATAGSAGRSAADPTTTHTVTRTVTVTTPAPAPKPVYASYLAALSFGPTGQTPQQLDGAPRFTVLPSLTRVAAVFLGILGDGRTAEFLVSNRAAVTGDGSCHPSRLDCVYLTLRPGSEELFLLRTARGRTFEYALRDRAVRVTHSSTPTKANVSGAGRHLVAEVAKLLPSLRTLRYSPRTGLMSLDRLRR